jgi:hypothetical protein
MSTMHTTGPFDTLLAEIIDAQAQVLLANADPQKWPKASEIRDWSERVARQYENAKAFRAEWKPE